MRLLQYARDIFWHFGRTRRSLALKKASVSSAPSDIRPIALLRCHLKVFKKLAHDQIVDFPEEVSLLDSLQIGFREYNSTQTALIKLTD